MNISTKIGQGELEEMRVLLETERGDVEEELSAYGRVQNELGEWGGASIGFEGQESDPNDVGDQIEELVTNVPLVAELEKRHTDVVDAIEKIENGTYGRCEECDEPIPLARLAANPAARTCIKHAEEE